MNDTFSSCSSNEPLPTWTVFQVMSGSGLRLLSITAYPHAFSTGLAILLWQPTSPSLRNAIATVQSMHTTVGRPFESKNTQTHAPWTMSRELFRITQLYG